MSRVNKVTVSFKHTKKELEMYNIVSKQEEKSEFMKEALYYYISKLNLPCLKTRDSWVIPTIVSKFTKLKRSSYAINLNPSFNILILTFISLSWCLPHSGQVHSLKPKFLTFLF